MNQLLRCFPSYGKQVRLRTGKAVRADCNAYLVRLAENDLQNVVFLCRKALKRIGHYCIAFKKAMFQKNTPEACKIVKRVNKASRNKRIVCRKD